MNFSYSYLYVKVINTPLNETAYVAYTLLMLPTSLDFIVNYEYYRPQMGSFHRAPTIMVVKYV